MDVTLTVDPEITFSPQTEESRQAFAAERELSEWWSCNWERLLRQYQGEFVAVRDGQVVAHHSELPKLWKELRARGFHHSETRTRFIDTPSSMVVPVVADGVDSRVL